MIVVNWTWWFAKYADSVDYKDSYIQRGAVITGLIFSQILRIDTP